jgi:urea carboxylase
MALYNVESPGGYMNTGLSIPGADILGFKNGYNSERPWLFEDFDQITFYEVSEDEYEDMMAVFRSGRYEYEYEDGEFDMKEHNQLLRDTKDEVAEIRKKQRQAQAEMDRLEKELLEKWNKEKEAGKISLDTVEELLNGMCCPLSLKRYPFPGRCIQRKTTETDEPADPEIIAVEAPLNANVWKVEVQEGDAVKVEQVVSILEAMKLEIPVKAEQSMQGAKVEKLLVKPNDVVEAGKPLMLLRRAK